MTFSKTTLTKLTKKGEKEIANSIQFSKQPNYSKAMY